MNLEPLKRELIKAGASKQQTESKIVPIVVSVLANNPDIATVSDLEFEIEELKREESKLLRRIECYKRYSGELEDIKRRFYSFSDASELYEKVIELCDEVEGKINEFKNSLPEDAESRKAVNAAQFFINNVQVNTKYDNTAYIAGLASILSGKQFDNIGCLVDLNPELFEASKIAEPLKRDKKLFGRIAERREII